jgi:hypothetical protein
MGKGVMAPDYVLGGFEIKVGLRISRGNEGRVWRHGRQGGLRDALFGAAKDGAENGNEELTTLVGEGIAKWAVCTVGWYRLQADRTRRKGWMQGRLMSLVRREKTFEELVRLERVREHRPRQCHFDVSFQSRRPRCRVRRLGWPAGWVQARGRLVERMGVH